jgi:chromosome segregation ATPase
VRATGEHGKAAAQIEAATRRLGALGPELEHKSRTQADDAKEARAAIAQISEMARRLAALQGDQTRVSEQTLRAVEEIQQAQRGQDEALRGLE